VHTHAKLKRTTPKSWPEHGGTISALHRICKSRQNGMAPSGKARRYLVKHGSPLQLHVCRACYYDLSLLHVSWLSKTMCLHGFVSYPPRVCKTGVWILTCRGLICNFCSSLINGLPSYLGLARSPRAVAKTVEHICNSARVEKG
jgi:hypothetical protein